MSTLVEEYSYTGEYWRASVAIWKKESGQLRCHACESTPGTPNPGHEATYLVRKLFFAAVPHDGEDLEERKDKLLVAQERRKIGHESVEVVE